MAATEVQGDRAVSSDLRERRLQLRVLGPMEALADGVPLTLGGRKERTALALLVADAGNVVATDDLIDGVWGDEPTAAARSTLHTYISNLRGRVGDVIVRDGGGYRLETEPDQVDAFVFEHAVSNARELAETDQAQAAQTLRQALALWRGRPYADVAGSPPLDVEARRLEELRLEAVEARIDAELALGRHAELAGELEVLCEENPVRERFRAQHMLALYRSGRQAEALRAYQKTRAYLADELGLDPTPELQELERLILTQDRSLLPDTEPQVQTRAFLLTDVEDSTVLWELHTDAMRAAMAEHDRVVLGAVKAAGGEVVKRVGDGVDIAFTDSAAAISAAQTIQIELSEVDWRETGPLRVRMAIDAGEVEARGGDYFGPVLNRAGRLLAAAHGGQVLLSGDAHGLSSARSGWQAKALGEYRFKGIGAPVTVFQLVVEGLPADFPPLRIDRPATSAARTGFGRAVRGYELREQVGAGDFGVVYRAYQPSVGREVAIKVIRPELVNEAAFIRRFEAEAQLVAQLEHPHIVSLYDYWRDPEGAYLVMRWLRGGSLRQALERGGWKLETASRLLAQVGSALAYAHRQGVVHRDLKPANVLLDEEGHAYLSDFGIAARLSDPDDPRRVVSGSPAYLPPEEIAGEAHTPRSDIYGLGLLTFELLTGERPPMDGPLPSVSALRRELPPALDGVVGRATALDPGERYASVDELLTAFAKAAGTNTSALADTYTPAENPYKGLRAFGESDAEHFFGRDALVDELVAAVAEQRLVAVVGPSGIGKSSVVKAGLVPALRKGALPNSDRWLVADLFPGAYPFEELAASLLRVAVERPDDLVEELARDELGIRRAVKRILPPGSELLLVVDQFEELFTLTTDEEMRRRFLDGLTALAADPRAPVRVVVTLRADFLDHPLRYPEFGELLGAGMVTVAAPSEDELAEAIERPAATVGVRFEAGLVSHIVADVHDQPGALPLLQYALTELFSARTSDLLTLDGYRATGGVVGALGRRAEELYARLDAPAKRACRQVFLRLVSVDPTGQDTRRRVRRRELRGLELEPDVLEEILGRYGEHRLLSFDREPVTRTPTVEVAHEAILGQWHRLRAWIDERREDLLLHRRVVEAVAEWEDGGRDPEYLPREGRLAQFEAWAEATDLALTAGEREFLAEARAAADVAARRRARRRRAILAGFVVLAAAASLLAAFALVLRGHARDEARLQKARQLAASAEANLQLDPELSILLALESAETTRRHDGTVLRETEQALHDALGASRVLTAVPGVGRRTGIGHVAHFAPDGTTFIAADAQGRTASLRAAATGERLATLEAHSEVLAVGYSPRGDVVATGGADGTARLWSAETGALLHTLRAHDGAVLATRFDAAGDRLVTVGTDRAVRVWDVRSGRKLQALVGVHGRTNAQEAWAEGVAFVGDDRIAVSPWARGNPVSPIVARIFDVSSGAEVGVIEHADGDARAREIDVSPDGKLLVATNGDSAQLELYRLSDGELLDVVEAHTGAVLDVEFSRDGSVLATGGVDGAARVWEIRNGKLRELLAVTGHATPVGSVSLSGDATRLVTVGQISQQARVWDVSPAGRGEVLTLPGPQSGPIHPDITFTPDGRRLVASSGPAGTVRVWNTKTGAQILVLKGHARAHAPVHGVIGIDVSPDGSRIATAGADGSARVYDAKTGEELLVVRGRHCSRRRTCAVNQSVFSPDGTKIATTGADATARIMTADSGRELMVFRGHKPVGVGTYPVDWSADGERLFAFGPSGLRVWDVDSGRLLMRTPPTGGPAFGAAWTPDGKQIVMAELNPRVWDAATGRRVRTVQAGAPVGDVAFSRDGTRLVMATVDGTSSTRVWDWPRDVELLKLTNGGFRIALSPDGKLLAGVRSEPTPYVKVWALDVDRLLEIARARVTRSLTQAECRQYLQGPCP
jgi:WD40 repeat protein/serine/threonine protein kinase/DNA-binding SARP family transcriptional activator